MSYGTPIDIRHTSELKPGDVVYVEFPAFSLGRLKFGEKQALTVQRVENNGATIVVRTEAGEEMSFAGGTKEELLQKLGEKTSFSKVVVYRPTTVAPEASPAEPEVAPGPEYRPMSSPLGVPPLLAFAGILGAGALVYSIASYWQKRKE